MQNSLAFAKSQDKNDVLKKYRRQFHFPQHEGNDVLYFCGNSLGLQPKSIKKALLNELEQWSKYGVEGHFMGDLPWMHYHKFLTEQSASLVGALPEEVVVMNTLTTNLHLMMVSFYRPTATRYKIIMEGGAFPSDQYAMESQVRFHGFLPEDAIIEIHPREGEQTLRTSDIVKIIFENKESLALVMFSGVNYYTGQFFDIQAITKAGHEASAQVGFDLAHTAGNLPLKLHDWNVDFAVWCSYKYLNSGPGGPSGVFVHKRHASNPNLPRFAGWWGHDEKERFQMKKGFIPMHGAAGWQTSNAQIFSFAAHKASLDIFHEIGMDALREKSIALTTYFYEILESINKKHAYFDTITPKNTDERGCQVSVLTGERGREMYDYLAKNGVVCDWREPNVIRFAPVPLYNSFEDVFKLGQLLGKAVAYGL